MGALSALGAVTWPSWYVRDGKLGQEVPRAVRGFLGLPRGIQTQMSEGPEAMGAWGHWAAVGQCVDVCEGEVPGTVRVVIGYFGGAHHVICWAGAEVPEPGAFVVLTGDIEHVRCSGARGDYWREVVRLRPCPGGLPPGWNSSYLGQAVRGYPDLAKWPGAEERACDAELSTESGGWKRYLQDHASKSKQGQVLEAGAGRHWGKIGAALFVSAEELGGVEFGHDVEAFARFLRCFNRLRSPKCLKAHQDGRRRFAVSSSRTGDRVYFSNRETVHRLAVWALQETKARREVQGTFAEAKRAGTCAGSAPLPSGLWKQFKR